jgi:hypothetical protein
MPTIYEVQAPDGSILEIEGPDNATDEQIAAFAAQQFGAPNAREAQITVTLRPDITDPAERQSMGLEPLPARAGEVPIEQLDYVPGTEAAGDTSALGLVGATTRGLAAPMAGAAIGAAMGAPFAGVGAAPGAAAGLAAGALTEALGDPIVRGVNSIFGTNFTEPTTALQNLLTNLGVPEADSEAERIVQKMATGVAGGVGGVGMGKALSGMAGASRPVMQRVGAAMAEQPVAQIAGGAGAGLAAGLVPEDAGVLAETGAALVGGLAGGAAGAGIAARRMATPGGATGAAGASGGRASGGAAATPESALRLERAERLGVEILPPQASRDFVSQQRMRELAKNNDVGGPIRDRLDRQSNQLRQRFESFIEGTGSEQWDKPAAQGDVIADALGTLAKRERTRIKALYNRAERAGELREPVSYAPVVDFINQQTPTTRQKLAPVLQVVEEQFKANDVSNSGQISLKQMEDVRQLINKVAQPGTPDYAYGRDLKELIDLATQDAGGDVYKSARAARARYANEFENIALVNNLIGFKPGNVDRIVALENVVEHITRPATSLASVNSFMALLDRAGPRGKRAMNELQGAVMENIREAAYSGISRDQGGGIVINPDKLNKALYKLDRVNKLDAIFDKQTAQTLRDVNLLVQDIATAPPGTLNPAGTSSAIINAIDMLAMLPGIGGLAARGVGKAR